MSFRFYDPLLAILQNDINQYQKSMFQMKREVNIKNLFEQSATFKSLQKIGVQEQKLSYKLKKYHSLYQPREINYTKSYHCSKMQTGKCITIEHKIEDFNLENIYYKTETKVREIDGDINFNYVKRNKVEEQNKKF